MGLVEIVGLWVLFAIAAVMWGSLMRSRALASRLWALLARKPHRNRRGYAMRMMVVELESLRVLAPAATAMLVAALLMCYGVYLRRWPDLMGVAVFISTSVVALTTAGIKWARLARRAGFTCPACDAQLGDPPRGPGFLHTGRCAVCTTVVFQVPLGVWNPQWPPEALRRKYGSVARHNE